MKPRTANYNALVSFIPFFGISSFYYLGKKLGLAAWGLTIIGTVLVSFGIGFIVGMSDSSNYLYFVDGFGKYIIIASIMISSYVVQYYIIFQLTDIKIEKDAKKCCGFHSCWECKDTSPCDEKNCYEPAVTLCEICKERLY